MSARNALRLCYFLLGFTFATWASRIPSIKTALHLTDGQLGAILFATPIGQLLSLRFSGQVVTRHGSHRVAPWGMAAYTGVLFLCGLATTGWQLAVALFLFGLSGNVSSTSLHTQAVLLEKQAGKPLMASFHGGWSVAGFCAGLTGLWVVDLGLPPWQHFAIVAAVGILLSPFLGRCLLAGEAAPKTPGKRRLDPHLWRLGFIGFCSMGTEGCMFDWSGVYFRDVVHAPPTLVVLGYTSFMVMMASGRLFGDRFIARVGRLQAVGMGGLLMSAGLWLSVLSPTLGACTAAFMLVGLGCSPIIPTVYSLAGQARPEDPGNAIAAVGSVCFLGFLLGPPLIGGVADWLGLRASFALIACLGLVIPWLTVAGSRRPAEPNSSPSPADSASRC